VTIEVKVDTSDFDRLLADVPAALARAQRNALAAVGQAVASRSTLAFRTPELRPAPWAPRKPSYVVTVNKKTKKKTKKLDDHPLLIKSGSLRQSIGWKFQGDDAVAVGSDKEYASYHQFGTKRMPARPFFPFDASGVPTPQITRKIHDLVEKAYSEELRKLGFR